MNAFNPVGSLRNIEFTGKTLFQSVVTFLRYCQKSCAVMSVQEKTIRNWNIQPKKKTHGAEIFLRLRCF